MEDYTKDITDFVNGAIEKAKELGNGAKIRAQIATEEAKIREQYYQLGKKYYKLYNDTPESELLDIVDNIRMHKEKIAEYKEELEDKPGDEFQDVE